MTPDEVRAVLAEVRYLDWEFHLGDDDGRMVLQARFATADSTSGGAAAPQRCRKWLLSPFMTRGEVVQTALLAVLTAVEHEARERFTYQGEAIFGPHFDLESLLRVCAAGDARQMRG
jgi:hypothetical protein